MMTLAYKSDAPWNESAWKNERFDQLLLMARSELDAEEALRDALRGAEDSAPTGSAP